VEREQRERSIGERWSATDGAEVRMRMTVTFSIAYVCSACTGVENVTAAAATATVAARR